MLLWHYYNKYTTTALNSDYESRYNEIQTLINDINEWYNLETTIMSKNYRREEQNQHCCGGQYSTC